MKINQLKNGLSYIYQKRNRCKPTIFYLNGYRSSMSSLKTNSVYLDCETKVRNFLTFDYPGYGISTTGCFLKETSISNYIINSITLLKEINYLDDFENNKEEGGLIFVGYSIGGLVALHLAMNLSLKYKDICKGIVLISPSLDFIPSLVNSLSEKEKFLLKKQGYFQRESKYSSTPFQYSNVLISDGEMFYNHFVTDFKEGLVKANIPIIKIIHGMKDVDVDYNKSILFCDSLSTTINAPICSLTLIEDGVHRLSQNSDLEIVKQAISDVIYFAKLT